MELTNPTTRNVCCFPDNRIVFESVKCPGEHVGVLESGDVKKPRNTATGRHSQFQPKVIREVCYTVFLISNTAKLYILCK